MSDGRGPGDCNCILSSVFIALVVHPAAEQMSDGAGGTRHGKHSMNIKEVKDLINEILQSDISEFELDHTGTKLRLKRGFGSQDSFVPAQPSPHALIPVAPAPGVGQSAAVVTEESEESGLHFIASPIVGTFYRASSPSAEPYVKVGDRVEEGRILCIVEAMKLMNEIPSDSSGEIVAIYVENGHPVEFGQKLFGIRPLK
jgi:acetyl-CoA carboxylase biotin carboxyl carrier protein